MNDRPPNLLFLFPDQWRWDTQRHREEDETTNGHG